MRAISWKIAGHLTLGIKEVFDKYNFDQFVEYLKGLALLVNV